MICDRCGKTNTEFRSFEILVDISEAKNGVNFKVSNWIREVFMRYINALLNTKITREVNVCQSCISKMFRKLDKNV